MVHASSTLSTSAAVLPLTFDCTSSPPSLFLPARRASAPAQGDGAPEAIKTLPAIKLGHEGLSIRRVEYARRALGRLWAVILFARITAPSRREDVREGRENKRYSRA